MTINRDRRLAEMMGMCWHEPEWHILKTCRDGRYGTPCAKCGNSVEPTEPFNPDFSTPEWRAKLMDWATEQEWWDEFKDWSWDKAPDDDNDWVAYLWRNLPSLLVEYHGEGR